MIYSDLGRARIRDAKFQIKAAYDRLSQIDPRLDCNLIDVEAQLISALYELNRAKVEKF